MKFVSTAPFPTMYFQHRNARGEERWVVVMRVTLSIAQDGSLSFAEPQPEINFSEEAFGDFVDTPIRRESDLAPEKPKVDLVVNANAYAPAGKPARRFDVGMVVREADGPTGQGKMLCKKQLAVTGPRQWRRRNAVARGAGAVAELASLNLLKTEGWTLTEPEPTESVPLRYDYAYGGTIRLDDDPREPHDTPLVMCHPDNPVGRGYVPAKGDVEAEYELGGSQANRFRARWAERHEVLPAPQIELPDRPLRSLEEPYPLAGWGVVPKHWALRHDKSGTFDQAWLANRHPLLPLDFNANYWNGAHPDLQFDHLPEDAVIEFHGVVPSSRVANQVLRIRLPGLKANVGVIDYENDGPVVHRLPMDTVQIDLLDDEVTLLYRINLPDRPSLAHLALALENLP